MHSCPVDRIRDQNRSVIVSDINFLAVQPQFIHRLLGKRNIHCKRVRSRVLFPGNNQFAVLNGPADVIRLPARGVFAEYESFGDRNIIDHPGSVADFGFRIIIGEINFQEYLVFSSHSRQSFRSHRRTSAVDNRLDRLLVCCDIFLQQILTVDGRIGRVSVCVFNLFVPSLIDIVISFIVSLCGSHSVIGRLSSFFNVFVCLQSSPVFINPSYCITLSTIIISISIKPIIKVGRRLFCFQPVNRRA